LAASRAASAADRHENDVHESGEGYRSGAREGADIGAGFP
jgi:hypothetical protein